MHEAKFPETTEPGAEYGEQHNFFSDGILSVCIRYSAVYFNDYMHGRKASCRIELGERSNIPVLPNFSGAKYSGILFLIWHEAALSQ